MKRPSLAVVCCAVVLAAVAGGCSLTQPSPPPTLFQQMDTNHDGKVSRAEFNAGFADALLKVNGLGPGDAITPAQWRNFELRPKSDFFQRLDVNHDGKLTRNELASGARRDSMINTLFNRIDKNSDGFISVEEGRPSGLDRTPQERAEGTGL